MVCWDREVPEAEESVSCDPESVGTWHEAREKPKVWLQHGGGGAGRSSGLKRYVGP